MDEEKRVEEAQKATKDQIKVYKALAKLSGDDKLAPLINLMIETATTKMLWTFTGDNVKSWDDFCRVRGEVVSYLYPIQEIKGAQAMVDHLKGQLESYYQE